MNKKRSPKNTELKDKKKLETQEILNSIENLKNNGLINSYLGNKGYSIFKVCLNNKIIEFIKKELTVKPLVQGSFIEPSSFPVYMESEKKIYVPRFWGIKIFGNPKFIKINAGESINLKFQGSLRDYQTNVINHYLSTINFNNHENKGDSSALIELECGGGKTVLALKIIETLKKKTVIFVQKTFLKNQWIERIQQFLPDAKIGSIQGQTIDIENKDIVIAMVQSISMKSYPESMFNIFGLSIYDEVHHMSSEVFSNCLKKCNTLYSLGLSATMNRKDGLTFVFKMYLGEICYKNKEEKKENNVLVKAIDYKAIDDDYNEIERDYRGNIKYSTMISKISNYNYRSDFILDVIENELTINKDQQIILLAHTKSLLNYLYKEIKFKNKNSVGFYIGGMKTCDLKTSENKQIILATFAMAAEALDIKTLTTLFLATPKSDIVQAVGRILRQKHNQPLIIDIIDSHDPFINQFQKRKTFYNEKGYKIIRTNNEKYIEYIKQITQNNNSNNQALFDTTYNLYWNEIIPKLKKNSNNSKKNSEKEAICLL